jgi:hypothetical protein
MIHMFHTCGMLELSLNPCVGQPSAVLYSDTAQITTRSTVTAAAPNRVLNEALDLDLLTNELAQTFLVVSRRYRDNRSILHESHGHHTPPFGWSLTPWRRGRIGVNADW